jgi:sugar O-acyltransferase (sialic acid O-acetyltransferase NeuD family)
MTRLYIWGAGGHGKVVLECAMASWAEIAFLDDDAAAKGRLFCGKPVFPARLHRERLAGENASFLIAIGDNRIRAACFETAREFGLEPATAVHPAAIVSKLARIGSGTVVMPGAVINPGAEVGRNCIVNTGAIIEHDCVIGDHAHISPRAALGGNVRVGPYAHFGLGAIALPGSIIGASAVVGAGAVVLKSVPQGETAIGVPARLVHSK